MRTVTLRQRLRYRFDSIMARGPIALIGWLFLLSVLLIVVVALVMMAVGLNERDGEKLGFGPLIWRNLMRAMDAGALGADSGSPAFLLAMFVVTMGGIFIVSILIGILTSGIEGRLESLRKGRSLVIETNHTVILGWSSQVFEVVSELIVANRNQRRSTIVIMAEKDKVEMEDELRDKIEDFGRTKLVCRTGSPADLNDLEIVNPAQARSVVILAPETDNPDAQVIKTMLALTNNPKRRRAPYHIVSEIHDAENLDVARLVGKQEAELILVGDLIARITVQTCRQSGLSAVYTDLLDFSGDEIYFHAEPGLAGKTFREALFAYEQSAVIGVRRAAGVRILPELEYVLQPGDALVAISQDDNTIVMSTSAKLPIDAAAISTIPARTPKPENTLILGWNPRALTIVRELDKYVASGSTVTVVAESVDERADLAAAAAACTNQTVSLREGATTARSMLTSLPLESFDHVIVLSYSDTLPIQEADAHTLMTLLHLRDLAQQHGYGFSIVSEMLDVRNRALAEVTQADDFIVSNKLVGLMLAQIAENKDLALVFADLFDAEGAEIYLRPAREYVSLEQPVSFYTVLEAAARRGEIAIGYRLKRESAAAPTYGVHLNPAKSPTITFEPGDRVIVIASA